mgnify:CR=1 FL=1
MKIRLECFQYEKQFEYFQNYVRPSEMYAINLQFEKLENRLNFDEEFSKKFFTQRVLYIKNALVEVMQQVCNLDKGEIF